MIEKQSLILGRKNSVTYFVLSSASKGHLCSGYHVSGCWSTGMWWWNDLVVSTPLPFSLQLTICLLSSQGPGLQKILVVDVQSLTSAGAISGAILWYWFLSCRGILISLDFTFVNNSGSWYLFQGNFHLASELRNSKSTLKFPPFFLWPKFLYFSKTIFLNGW